MKCAICGKEIKRDGCADYFGNNPSPIRNGENDRCCDACNDIFVVPARIVLMQAASPEQADDIVNKLEIMSYDKLKKLFC